MDNERRVAGQPCPTCDQPVAVHEEGPEMLLDDGSMIRRSAYICPSGHISRLMIGAIGEHGIKLIPD